MSEYDFGQFTPKHLTKVREGIELYNKEFFLECHEALEDAWLEDVNDSARLIYWAIIQVATSLHHVRDENTNGARGMLSKAKEKIQKAEDSNVETDVLFNNLSWQKFKQLVRAVPDDSKSLKDYDQLYQFKFSEFK